MYCYVCIFCINKNLNILVAKACVRRGSKTVFGNETANIHVQQYMHGGLSSLALAVESALKVNQTLKVLSFIDNAPMSVADATAEYPEKFYGGLFIVLEGENYTLKSLTIADESFLKVIANEV